MKYKVKFKRENVYDIDEILKCTGYKDWEELKKVEYNKENPDDLMLNDENEKLSEIYNNI